MTNRTTCSEAEQTPLRLTYAVRPMILPATYRDAAMGPRIQDCTAKQLNAVRALFEEYSASVGIELCFQHFDREVAGLPGDYAPPTGRLLVASDEKELAGCVALRRIDDQVYEMKRLYVRPSYRRTGLGRNLAQAVLAAARDIGYTSVRLHTLPSMKEAIRLYGSLGFVETPSYRRTPMEGVRYMELVWGR